MTMPARSLVELYARACDEYAQRPALGRRTERGWIWLTYADLEQQIDTVRGGLRQLGVGFQDRVAIVSDNRIEWPAACYACFGLGAVLVPIAEAAAPAEWKAILADSHARVVIAGRADVVDALEVMREDLPALEHIVGIDVPAEDVRSFVTLCARGASLAGPALEPAPDTLAELVYSHDGAGPLHLSHARLIANVRALQELLPIDPDEQDVRCVASVPWAHVLGRLADLHHGLGSGVAVAIPGDPARLLAEIADVRPTRLVAGPALLRHIYHVVIQDVWQQPPLLQRMFHDGLAAAARKTAGEPVGLIDQLELFLDEELIFARVRDQLGGRLSSVLCAGGLCHEVAGVLQAMGVAVVGVDAVGPIDDEGHLMVSPERDEYQLSTGQSVVPAPVEEAIKLSPYVRDVMVYGQGHRHNVALVVPDVDAVAGLAQRLGVPLADPASDQAVVLLLAEQMRERLEGFPRHVVPRRFAVIGEEFSVENGLLTAALELRRERIAARYSAEINYLYTTPPPPPRPRRPRTAPPPHSSH